MVSEDSDCQLMAFYRRLDEDLEIAALEHLEHALANSARAGKSLRHADYLQAASRIAEIRKQAPRLVPGARELVSCGKQILFT